MTKRNVDQPKDQRFNMFISASELDAIDRWSWDHRVRSKSEAVRRLCQLALHLEPWIAQLPAIERQIAEAEVQVEVTVRDAIEGSNSSASLDECLQRIDRASEKLDAAALELNIHVNAMTRIASALADGADFSLQLDEARSLAEQAATDKAAVFGGREKK